MSKLRNFSVVMATYTGETTIDSAFNSMIKQRVPASKYEVIVVIDGPNTGIRQKAEHYKKLFEDRGIGFRIHQFKKNKGRFEARYEGSKLAKHEYLLIADDRVEIPINYFKYAASSGEEVLVPDVKEKPPRNFVSLTLNRLRRVIYGDNWQSNFKSYYINAKNFDKSPKGTSSLWINRGAFLKACEVIASTKKRTNSTSDDTRILREVIDQGFRIFKTSDIKILYEPRAMAIDELTHIYNRAPRFIDYYFQPGTRYFVPLLLFYLLLIPLFAIIALWPWFVVILISGSVLFSLFIITNPLELISIVMGLWAVVITFAMGLIVGLAKKVMQR